jgi:DNA replication factor GINS
MGSVGGLIDLYSALECIKVAVNRDVDRIDLGLLTIGPYRAGSIVTMPPQFTEIMIKRGVASLPSESRITPEEVQKRLWLESRSPGELRPLPRDFYLRARLSTDRVLLNQLRELVQLRLRKIMVQVSMNPTLAETREFLEKLTLEEEVLVRFIASHVKDFLGSVVIR